MENKHLEKLQEISLNTDKCVVGSTLRRPVMCTYTEKISVKILYINYLESLELRRDSGFILDKVSRVTSLKNRNGCSKYKRYAVTNIFDSHSVETITYNEIGR